MLIKGVNKKHILEALEYIDWNGVPGNRKSTKFDLVYKEKRYPPKYVISIATKIATGRELEAWEFHGGDESNSFLISKGFKVQQGTSEVHKSKSKKITICSALIQTEFNLSKWNKLKFDERIVLLEKIVTNLADDTDLLILPAGFFNTHLESYTKQLKNISENTVRIILKHMPDLTICVGIDGYQRREHMGAAINKNGVIAIARKFHGGEPLILADTGFELESGKSRIFDIKGKKAYIAVCYDTFGIYRDQLKKNREIDFVVSLIHGFAKSGRQSSSSDFARKGMAGAAKFWEVPVIGSAVFAEGRSFENWPVGVKWEHGNESVSGKTFDDIRILGKSSKDFGFKDLYIRMSYFMI